MTCKKNNYTFGFHDNIYIVTTMYVDKKYNIYRFVKCNKILVKSTFSSDEILVKSTFSSVDVLLE